MFNANEIRQITFEKVVRGYRPEDVESFMEKIADEFETLSKEKQEIESQLYILAERIEEYKNEEEAIKSTLINAQKLGESVIEEARQKAEAILKDANIRKNDILSGAHEELASSEQNLARIKREVSEFKISVLGMYKTHIESLSQLPEVKREPANVVEAPQELMVEENNLDTAENLSPQYTLEDEDQEEEVVASVTEEASFNISYTEEDGNANKKALDDYELSPEVQQGFNNISTLFDK